MKCKNCRNIGILVDVSIGQEESIPWCLTKYDSPDLDIERDCDFFESMTNADRIRNMTDEELAEFLSCDTDDVIACRTCKEPINEYGSCSGLCRNEYLRWLQKEVGK